MALLREPWDLPDSERDRALESGTHRKVVRRARSRIAEGSLSCPSCDLPLLLSETITVAAALECPFCGRRDAARSFLRLGSPDVGGNRVELIARLPV
jgi:hypothetical protein